MRVSFEGTDSRKSENIANSLDGTQMIADEENSHYRRFRYPRHLRPVQLVRGDPRSCRQKSQI
jgi:hypothetical protein